MSPRHSSLAQANLRWRDGLQARFCAKYSIMHQKAFHKGCLIRLNSPGFAHLFDKNGFWITGAQIDDDSSLYSVSNATGVTPLNVVLSCNRCASKQYTPPDKQQIYNRMNGSPGDPPGTHMHKFKPKRITPFTHRLVSDPTGMEAGWETLT
jgi:hypothetical protein